MVRSVPAAAAAARNCARRSPLSASTAASRISVATAFRLRPSRAARAANRRCRSSGTRSKSCFTPRCYHIYPCDITCAVGGVPRTTRSSLFRQPIGPATGRRGCFLFKLATLDASGMRTDRRTAARGRAVTRKARRWAPCKGLRAWFAVAGDTPPTTSPVASLPKHQAAEHNPITDARHVGACRSDARGCEP